MKLSRREAIKLGLIGGGSLLFAAGIQDRYLAQSTSSIEPFRVPLKIPPVLKPIRSDDTTDYYEVVAQKSSIEILPDLKTEIWGYNGITPGPTIRQRQGRQSVVRFLNQLGKDSQGQPIDTVVHLHGMATLPQYDGYTTDYIPPQHFKDYVYPNDRAGTLWYHDHVMDLTARNIDAGLAGMYIVEDEYERSLQLPQGDYEIPLILQTKRLAKDGSLVFYNRTPKNLYGNVLVVNGVPLPHLKVANRKYRFRILNGSASQLYQLVLSRAGETLTEGEKLVVIGSDTGLLGEPVEIIAPYQILPVAMGERYDVIVDFSRYPIGTQVFLHNVRQGMNFSGSLAEGASLAPIMRFDVVRQETDNSRIPDRMKSIEPIPVTPNLPKRTFIFGRNKQGKWTINEKIWDENRIDANPQPGTIEIWEFINPDKGRLHPVHLHFADTQLLDRNGLPPHPYERGWKDVFLLGERETLRIVARFRGQGEEAIAGKFMMHCHHLIHEDGGAMTQFEVGQGGLDPITTAPAQPILKMS